MSEPIEVGDVVCLKETEKALLVEVEGEQVWVPKSQVQGDSEVTEEGDEGILVVAAWFAREKGWL